MASSAEGARVLHHLPVVGQFPDRDEFHLALQLRHLAQRLCQGLGEARGARGESLTDEARQRRMVDRFLDELEQVSTT